MASSPNKPTTSTTTLPAAKVAGQEREGRWPGGLAGALGRDIVNVPKDGEVDRGPAARVIERAMVMQQILAEAKVRGAG